MPAEPFKSFHLVFLFLMVVNSASPSAAQSRRQQFKQLSCPEKRWVIFHPFVAKKAYMLTQAARAATERVMNDALLDKDPSGGQADAFRHSYWMALLSQNISWRKARWLGKAHEKGNYRDFKKRKTEEGILPDSASCAMDLYNNMKGIEAGRANKKSSEEELKILIIDAIRKGEMRILNKDSTGNYLDCETKKIDMNEWQGQWGIPKCLVPSNHTHDSPAQ